VGRGSVREALKILEATHLIQIRRGDGTYISNPDDISFANALLFKMILTNTSMDEMVEFREQIEISAVHLAVAHVQPEDLLLLKENISLFTACIENSPSDYAQLHKLDMGFHRLFAACMKNKLMEEIYLLAMDIFSPTILNNFETGQVLGADAQTTLISHKTIVQALETRDIHLGVHGVWQMLDIWKRWANKKKE
jgi:GntR family transcriptional repressor for pyruvate dehydrogenase complex